jgi:N-acetylglucosaminyl-diphospho-decaprenol L-rhamnosyltransferase
MPYGDISIIIVNYRSITFTRACLRSIYQSGFAACEVIVVDNASYDGSGEMIRSEFPEVTFLQSTQNLGFAGANNLGIGASHGTYLLFLNPDTEVEAHSIERLRSCLAATPDAGLAGARLLNSDGSIQTTCVTAFPTIANQVLGAEYLQRNFPAAKLWGIQALYSNERKPVPVDAVSGACVMARRSVILDVGGFTADYFMYSEDLDLCWKVQQAGWKVYHVPEAIVVHHGGRSSDTRSELNFAAIMIRESLYQFMGVSRGWWYARTFRAVSAASAVCRVALISALLPLAMLTSRRARVWRSWEKWSRILGWSLGLQPWTRRESVIPTSASDAARL